MNGVENQVQAAMQAAIEHLKEELKTLRTGRANSGILDRVQVEVYGSYVLIKSLGSITVPEPRQVVVTPFDPSNIHAITKAIEAANLGVHPISDGRVVRIPIPPPDEALRKQIARQCREYGEKSKVVMREVRRKFNELVRKQKSEGVISEDRMKKYEKEIQELTDKYCKNVDVICSEKEKEIMTV